MSPIAFEGGRNCWRVAEAERFGLIIDAADYFRALRATLAMARDIVVMIGWDFDFEIEMLPGESDGRGNAPDGLPNQVGPFLEALVGRRPGLDIHLLKWSGGALVAPSGIIPALRLNLMEPEQIHLAFDGHHPIGACHHQKIVVVDDAVAFCGGIDVTAGRWDTRRHRPRDLGRRLRNGQIAQAWHDMAAVLTGPAAGALGELARDRWKRARGENLPAVATSHDGYWPECVHPDFLGLPVAIARTEPPTGNGTTVAEIEWLYLDAIAAARDCLYIESQYFSSDSIARAIAARLAEPDGPEIVVINPEAAQNPIEDAAMHPHRSRLIRELQAADRHGRFRIFWPADSAGDAIYVHAKLLLADDWHLRVGSSNLDRRSMGFDTEADVAVNAAAPEDRARIRAIRAGLLAEHLAATPEAVEAAIARHGGVIGAIDALNRPGGRGLRPILAGRESLLARWLSESLIFDPRFQRSARNRLGLTNRHLLIGLGVLGLGAVILARRRRK